MALDVVQRFVEGADEGQDGFGVDVYRGTSRSTPRCREKRDPEGRPALGHRSEARRARPPEFIEGLVVKEGFARAKGGRPPLPPDEIKDVTLTVRVREDDRNRLDAIAATLGVTRSALLRAFVEQMSQDEAFRKRFAAIVSREPEHEGLSAGVETALSALVEDATDVPTLTRKVADLLSAARSVDALLEGPSPS